MGKGVCANEKCPLNSKTHDLDSSVLPSPAELAVFALAESMHNFCCNEFERASAHARQFVSACVLACMRACV